MAPFSKQHEVPVHEQLPFTPTGAALQKVLPSTHIPMNSFPLALHSSEALKFPMDSITIIPGKDSQRVLIATPQSASTIQWAMAALFLGSWVLALVKSIFAILEFFSCLFSILANPIL